MFIRTLSRVGDPVSHKGLLGSNLMQVPGGSSVSHHLYLSLGISITAQLLHGSHYDTSTIEHGVT
jgi:hypothetical protein